MRTARAAGREHGEVIIVQAYVILRLVALLQAVLGAVASYPHHRPLAAGTGLIAVVAAQSVALIAMTIVRRKVPSPLLTSIDVIAMAAELAVGAAICAPGYRHTWTYFVYPFSLIAIAGVGMSFRRLPAVLAVAAVPAAVYAVVNIALGEVPWNAALDTLPYLQTSGVAWLVAAALRRSSHQVDVAHLALTGREVELAEERERARHARMLHDRVLQVLEVLAQGDFVSDPALRGHVRAEAAWLRSFVRGDPPAATTDLPGALAAVAQDMARSGLVVELNTAQLADALRRRGQPSAETAQALADAAREALVNVLKHAGTRSAVLHAELTARTLTVSVLDHGCGFDDRVQEAGFGLTTSIRARITAIGGEVTVESQPDMGTYVELRVPAPAYLVTPT